MSEKSLRTSTIGRRLIVRAYQEVDQLIGFEELSRSIIEKTLQSQNLKLGSALLSLHAGGTKISTGCRIYGKRDIFGGAVVEMNSAVRQGHIQVIDEAIFLPDSSLPESKIVSMKAEIDEGARIPLGAIFSFDKECEKIPITGIFQDPGQIRITLDTVWLPWEASEKKSIAEIQAYRGTQCRQ